MERVPSEYSKESQTLAEPEMTSLETLRRTTQQPAALLSAVGVAEMRRSLILPSETSPGNPADLVIAPDNRNSRGVVYRSTLNKEPAYPESWESGAARMDCGAALPDDALLL
jgi:hypothetical protein